MSTTENILKVIDEHELNAVNSSKLSLDLKELNSISNSLPQDNILSADDCLNLERLCLRGMNICDFWLPIIHIVMSENEVLRDSVKSKAYIDAKAGDGRLTAEMRKAYSEADDEYNKQRIIVEKVKAMKSLFEKKRDTFKSAIFVFKDQFNSYKISDKGSSGDNLYYTDDKVSYGKIAWENG